MLVAYKPVDERRPDRQYHDLLSDILSFGEDVDTQQEEAAKILPGHMLKFPLNNGFPIITERDLLSPIGKGKFSIFHQALGELFAFLNGARTLAELNQFDCYWWKLWATKEKCEKRGLEPGDGGPGFYGAAWTQFPTSEGAPFNQIKHLVEQIKELPHLRTHLLVPWVPQYIIRGKGKRQRVTVVPCHGLVHVLINTHTRTLTLVHFQRSADVPVGLVCNIIQYAALAMMIAQVTGYTAKEVVHFISDAHIYEKQNEAVGELLETVPQTFATVEIDPTITKLTEFRQCHFKVSDYKPQSPARRIWTPI